MTTQSGFTGFSGSLSGFQFNDETLLPFPDQYVDASSVMDNPLITPDTEPCSSAQYSVDGDFLADDSEFSESVFKYISQMLMEEDMEEQQIFPDPVALQAAEKSLHQVLDGDLPSSSDHYTSYINSPDDSYYYSGNSSDYGAKSSSDNSTGGNGNSFGDLAENGGSAAHIPQNVVFQSSTTNPPLLHPLSNEFFSASHANGVVESLMGLTQFPNSSTQSELMSQFQKGAAEASKFLPNLGNQWFTDLDKVSTFNLPPKEIAPEIKIEEHDEAHHEFSNRFREKKNHEREDAETEGRRTKQSAVDLEEIELSEMFDKMFIFPVHEKGGGRGHHCKGPRMGLPRDAEASEEQTPKPRPKKPLNTNNANKEVVDLRMLLILAAQAVNADDRRTANEYLRQIRQHSSPLGDGSQRMAHYFANGLEARLDGNGSQIYNALASKRVSPVDVLKAYQVYLSVCPFQKLANIFSNNKILILAEETKSKSLHIIDFGILYGFQWPALIFRLSRRPGGPPKLRITGIELPEPGFRPAERVQQTGRHLAKCCERFNVPFEYNGIAQKWETIRIEDLKLREEDTVVVNCMFRFKNLLDQTVELNNPRDSVLNLVKTLNPVLFAQSVVNGSYGVPFFVTRFREALFHYSALFDALDASVASEDPMRMMFEKEWYGREVMNVIGCEGSERVERPETYKRWQIRNVRLGFKQLPLDAMIMRKLKFKLKGGGYNEDFVIDEDGEWMLQGWKGRIVYASTYWVPASA